MLFIFIGEGETSLFRPLCNAKRFPSRGSRIREPARGLEPLTC